MPSESDPSQVKALAATALTQAAWKHGILDKVQRDRLHQVMTGQELDDVSAVRSWLESGQGLDGRMSRKLAGCLAKPGQPSFGSYRPLSHLGEGGMGTVWLSAGYDRRLVVVKAMRRNLVGVDEFAKRFERETKVMRELDHPCLVQALDAGIASDGTPFLVLEYVASETLKQLAERKGLIEGLALTIVFHLLDALDHAHHSGLIHRDIKPSNIFADPGGLTKLGDFGLARPTDSGATSLTMAGSLVGTPHYMSPEQITAEGDIDIRADLYAVGAVLYFCLTGRDPYTGKHHEVLHAHRTAAIPRVREVNPSVGEATEQIIIRAMQKAAADRYANPAEMRAAVEQALAGIGIEAAKLREQAVAAHQQSSAEHEAAKAATEAAQNQATIVQTPAPTEVAKPSPLAPRADAEPPPDDPQMSASRTRTRLRPKTSTFTNRQTSPLAPREDAPAAAPSGLSNSVTVTSPVVPQEPTPPSLVALPDRPPTGELPTARQPSPDETVMADLMGEFNDRVDDGSGISRSATDDGSGAGATPVHGRASGSHRRSSGSHSRSSGSRAGERFEGDIATAIREEWIQLVEENGPRSFMCWAQPELCLGKMRQQPVQLCLRNYPVMVHKEACQAVSRQHGRVVLAADGLYYEDFGSANGSRFDGVEVMPRLPRHDFDGVEVMARQPRPIATGAEHMLEIAGTVFLRLRAIARRDEPRSRIPGAPDSTGHACGIECGHPCDALVMGRPRNRSELVYLQVLRRVEIGGSDAECPVPDASGFEKVELARYDGRWIWRPVVGGIQAWRPLALGDQICAGGRRFQVRHATYDDFS